jgi:hypothetical protein
MNRHINNEGQEVKTSHAKNKTLGFKLRAFTLSHSTSPITVKSFLTKTKMSFFKNRGQKGQTGPVWGLVLVAWERN